MKKKHLGSALLVIVFVVLAIGLAGLAYWKFMPMNKTESPKIPPQKTVETKPVDGRASFVIFTNGGVRIFSDSKYHNQSADVYITAEETNIVNIKKDGVTRQQFFDTLPAPMKVTSDCLYTGTGQTLCNSRTNSLKFYKNGKPEADLLQQPVLDGDKVLVSYGATNADVSAELSRVPEPR